MSGDDMDPGVLQTQKKTCAGHLCTVTKTVTNVTAQCWVTRRQYRQEGTNDEYLRDVVSSTNALGSELGGQVLPGTSSGSKEGVENVVIMRFIKETDDPVSRFVVLQPIC